MRAVITFFVTAVCLVSFASAASAQTAGKGKIKGKGDGNIRVNDADKGATDLGVIDIEGRIYKPSVFYVLARSDLSYQGLEFRQNFTDRIVKGAMMRPF
ncbi:MAG: hypothetical protein EXR79_00570 [Myxococcales bacterium]|nr:hypothetical protein [Myxococcales bacterium]